MPIRLGRWEIDIYQRAIHITRGPEPYCPTCAGQGGIEVYQHHYEEPDTVLCDCWDPTPVVRLPLWFRRAQRYPF